MHADRHSSLHTDPDDLKEKTVSTVSTPLLGLDRYTNYSITVTAYTRRGDGVRSSPIYCITEEDGMLDCGEGKGKGSRMVKREKKWIVGK
ncbi:Down syndrome cell adhesion molecule-like protein Dscam2 [Portunus trituberculatus]|uniref:Down syndrome cell adhesion molecule-like protein Dscam2 n=1 Tax=Portunus trituberculatus TaxID=210409 RepID=A0A5B7JMG0_PORTR|nr:Down syndrome cell adhesion molecule-like protein Dscam2 [Portunus trituberculatus]